MGSKADRWAAIATHTRDLSPELVQGLQEVSYRALLHTCIPRDRAGETSKREHGREKTSGRPRIPQEQRLLRVNKLTLMPVHNKGRDMLFDSHTKVIEVFVLQMMLVVLYRSW